VAAQNRFSISCLARDIAAEIGLYACHASNCLGLQDPDAGSFRPEVDTGRCRRLLIRRCRWQISTVTFTPLIPSLAMLFFGTTD
jgi:hypothetical protein